jgi:hypothetical protein
MISRTIRESFSVTLSDWLASLFVFVLATLSRNLSPSQSIFPYSGKKDPEILRGFQSFLAIGIFYRILKDFQFYSTTCLVRYYGLCCTVKPQKERQLRFSYMVYSTDFCSTYTCSTHNFQPQLLFICFVIKQVKLAQNIYQYTVGLIFGRDFRRKCNGIIT